MSNALVANDERAQRPDGKQERRNSGHDEGLIAGDAHVPQGKVYRRVSYMVSTKIFQKYLHQMTTPKLVKMDQNTNCHWLDGHS